MADIMDTMETDTNANSEPTQMLDEARKQLDALKQAGLSHEALLALLNEGVPQPQQRQTPQSSPPQTPGQTPAQVNSPPPQQQQQHVAQHLQPNQQSPFQYNSQLPHQQQQTSQTGAMEVPSLPHGFPMPNLFLGSSPQMRSSIASTTSTSSGRESIMSTMTTATAASSIARSTTPSNDGPKYFCTACDKTFKRKFDWKRHEEEFHERWRKYPCPNCNQSFWGPNTFNQHHKSAHGCRTCPHSDVVVKYMQKRKAWGCGFCAALHSKLEKHYEHVAAHCESGSQKADWLHSNVIYGLLHQPLIHEAWKKLIARKNDKFNGHQPMFSWSPDNTGRAQGFVEQESPGQLQDFLEFFDGTPESAEKLAQCAWGYVQIVLKPQSSDDSDPNKRMSTMSAMSAHSTMSAPPSLQRRLSSRSQSQGPRKRTSASASLMPGSGPPSRSRTPSADFRDSVPAINVSEPVNHHFQAFLASQPFSQEPMQTGPMDMGQRSLSLNKALPPAPLMPSAMDLDYDMYTETPPDMLKPPPPNHNMIEDWQSMASTLLAEQPLSQPQGHATFHNLGWDNLSQYGGSSPGR